jgi:hypothetical protein
MLITLTNSFHNSEVRIRVREFPHTITESQHRRIERALCGIDTCRCGTIRGHQYHDGARLDFETEADIFGDPVLVIHREGGEK